MSNIGTSQDAVNATQYRINGVKILDNERYMRNINRLAVDGTIVCENLLVKSALLGQGVNAVDCIVNSTNNQTNMCVNSQDIDLTLSGNNVAKFHSNGATQIGVDVTALDRGSFAEGHYTTAINPGCHSEGQGVYPNAHYTSVEQLMGLYANTDIDGRTGNIATKAVNFGAHAEGIGTVSSGTGSHSEGGVTQAEGYFSHAEGLNTKAINLGAHSEGDQTVASGYFSHAEGSNTKSMHIASHSEGSGTQAQGEHSHAEGISSIAAEYASHAEGGNCHAIGMFSHAQGKDTGASGRHSFSAGEFTNATGDNSFAGGEWTVSSAHNSVALGQYSDTRNKNEISIGSIEGSVDGFLVKSQYAIVPTSIWPSDALLRTSSLFIADNASWIGKVEVIGRSQLSSNTWACVYDAVVMNDGTLIQANVKSQYVPILLPPDNGLQGTIVTFGDNGSASGNGRAFGVGVNPTEQSGFSITFTGTQIIANGNVKTAADIHLHPLSDEPIPAM